MSGWGTRESGKAFAQRGNWSCGGDAWVDSGARARNERNRGEHYHGGYEGRLRSVF
jgi:hypothetical protein